jgi:hypothetical protein
MRIIHSLDEQSVQKFIKTIPASADVVIVRDYDTMGRYIIVGANGHIVKGAGGWRKIENATLYAEICGIESGRIWTLRSQEPALARRSNL